MKRKRRDDAESERLSGKREWWPYSFNGDFNTIGPDGALDAIQDAAHRDYALLAKHLREGTAHRDEMYVAAEILEGRIPPLNPGKPKSPKTTRRDENIFLFVQDLSESKSYPKEAAVAAAEKHFQLSRSEIYGALKRWAQIRREVKELEDADYEANYEEYERLREEDWARRSE